MNFALFLLGVLVLFVVLAAINQVVTGPRRARDRDADGEPDGPPER